MFTGIGTAIITPFNDNQIDYDALGAIVENQIAAGIAAIVVNGTTGEGVTMSHQEILAVIRFVYEKVAGRCKVIAGAGSNNTKKVVSLIAEIEAIGITDQMVVTPYYNKSSQAGLVAHYLHIADNCQSNILLYNVPSRTGVNIDVETVKTLAQHPRIIGLKEASGNMSYFARLTAELPADFMLYSGNDDLNHIIMAAGGHGAISVLSNAVPRAVVKQYQALKAGDYSRALTLQNQLNPLVRAVFNDVNPIGIKALMSMQGRVKNQLRLPLVPMNAMHYQQLENAYHGGQYED